MENKAMDEEYEYKHDSESSLNTLPTSYSNISQLTDDEVPDKHDEFVLSIKDSIPCITIEPLILFFIFIMYLQLMVLQQYIYYRVGIDYNITTNDSNQAYVCDSKNFSQSEKDKVDRLQSLSSKYSVAIQFCNSLTTIIFAPFYCVFSDRFGRRTMMFLPCFGAFIKSLIELLIIKFNCPLYSFMLTEGLYGCFGGFNFAISIGYSYVADISTKTMRTKRIALLGVLLAVGALIVSFISGIWIKAQGYLIPYIVTFVLSILCVLYTTFILKETPKSPENRKTILTPVQQLKTLFTIYLGRQKLQTRLLILMVIMFVFYYVAEMSTMSLNSTYLMAYPICMGVLELSFFSVINLLAINFGVFISTFFLTRCWSEMSIILLCIITGLVFCLEMAFAYTKPMIYIAAATNIFSFSAFPFLRGYLSKKMSASEQGALFGGLVLFETIGGSITKVVVVYFYRSTFEIFHGMVYLFLAFFSITAIVLGIIIKYLDMKIMGVGGTWEKIN